MNRNVRERNKTIWEPYFETKQSSQCLTTSSAREHNSDHVHNIDARLPTVLVSPLRTPYGLEALRRYLWKLPVREAKPTRHVS